MCALQMWKAPCPPPPVPTQLFHLLHVGMSIGAMFGSRRLQPISFLEPGLIQLTRVWPLYRFVCGVTSLPKGKKGAGRRRGERIVVENAIGLFGRKITTQYSLWG